MMCPKLGGTLSRPRRNKQASSTMATGHPAIARLAAMPAVRGFEIVEE